MAPIAKEKEFRTRLQRLEALLQQVERFADPAARAHTREIVQALLDLHGAGLELILEQVAAIGPAGLALIDRLAGDDLVGSLLLLHGLHPLGLEERVRRALEEVRPYLRSHGGNVELLGLRDGVVRLRLQGSYDGCPSSAVTMRQTIEEAILGKAPDVTAVEVEGLAEAPAATAAGPPRVALPVL
jgi:Fe-S cluster biogenesis protein NfuA